MSGLIRSLEYMSSQFNRAPDTKQSIICAANSTEYIKKMVEKVESKAKESNEEKVENIHFEPEEIETIVLRNTTNKER